MTERNCPDATLVELAPLGGLSAQRAQALAARLSRELATPCRLLDPGGLAPGLPGRPQGDADALLSVLESRARLGSVLLGVTAQDLGIPIFTFVFGRARLGGRAALVSLARLDPTFYGLPSDEEGLLTRVVHEAFHELGHLASLAHCERQDCLMRFAGSVEKADLRGGLFCGGCAGRLPAWLRGRAPR